MYVCINSVRRPLLMVAGHLLLLLAVLLHGNSAPVSAYVTLLQTIITFSAACSSHKYSSLLACRTSMVELTVVVVVCGIMS
jgi:hypothetical protein